MSTPDSYHAHIQDTLPHLHRALLDIVGIFMSPERDAAMLESVGLTLERALFPLLVLIGEFGPIGVVDLASRVGRDYTTVCRQAARLEKLGLIERRPSPADRRTRMATVTPQGRHATDAVARGRERLALELFRDWSQEEYDQLLHLIRRLADDLDDTPAPGSTLAQRRAKKA